MSDRHLLTIGRLAAHAGVTIKAVRVYHQRGLLPEPPRDASGYRRYGAGHAIQLVKIRTLVEAGVPLARIGPLLDAGPDELAAAVDEIDRTLRERDRPAGTGRGDIAARGRRRTARAGVRRGRVPGLEPDRRTGPRAGDPRDGTDRRPGMTRCG